MWYCEGVTLQKVMSTSRVTDSVWLCDFICHENVQSGTEHAAQSASDTVLYCTVLHLVLPGDGGCDAPRLVSVILHSGQQPRAWGSGDTQYCHAVEGTGQTFLLHYTLTMGGSTKWRYHLLTKCTVGISAVLPIHRLPMTKACLLLGPSSIIRACTVDTQLLIRGHY